MNGLSGRVDERRQPVRVDDRICSLDHSPVRGRCTGPRSAHHTHLKARPRDFKLARHAAIGIYDLEVDLWLNGAIPDKVANDSGESLINDQTGRTDFGLDVTLGPRRF